MSQVKCSDALHVTRRFIRAYRRLTPPWQEHCDATVRLLLQDPSHRRLRLRPIEPAGFYEEARVAIGGKLILMPHGDTVYVLDVVTPVEAARYGRP